MPGPHLNPNTMNARSQIQPRTNIPTLARLQAIKKAADVFLNAVDEADITPNKGGRTTLSNALIRKAYDATMDARRAANDMVALHYPQGDGFKVFRLAILSKNTNSFGLRHAVFVAEDGTAFECYPSAYGAGADLEEGHEVRLPLAPSGKPILSGLEWEMADHKKPAPAEVVAMVW